MKSIIDLTGQKFGLLTVREFVGRKNKHSMFRCVCECGKETVVTSNNLRRNHTTSCGCESERNKIDFVQNSIRHGLKNHPLYTSWIGMRNRCYYPKHNRFQHYGGKGIKVCEEWKDDFKKFYEWAIQNGWRKGLSIDREENHLDYCPTNCKFSNIPTQNRNRTSNVKMTYRGVTKILVEWAEEYGINYGTLYCRVKRGWRPEEVLYGKNTNKR